MVAVSTLVPVVPTMESPEKVASPATADLVAVPEMEALETVRAIEDVFPVMTLLSASRTRTTTSDSSAIAFAALAGATSSKLVAVPGASVIDWDAEVIPAVVLE
jgi:hypothetical protein